MREFRLDLSGHRVRILTAGSTKATPVVFLHGFGLSAEIWQDNLNRFATAGYAGYALDAPCFGGSSCPPGLQTLDRLAAWSLNAIQELGLERVVLVGSSMGGATALNTMLADPTRVRALVLCDPFGVGDQLSVSRELLRDFALPLFQMGFLGYRPRPYQRLLRINFHLPEEAPADIFPVGRGWAWRRSSLGKLGVALGLALSLGFKRQRLAFRDRIAAAVQAHQIPTLICWGRDDRLLPAAHAAQFAAALPYAETHLFEACGHLPAVEAAAHFNRLALAFLERNGVAAEAA